MDVQEHCTSVTGFLVVLEGVTFYLRLGIVTNRKLKENM